MWSAPAEQSVDGALDDFHLMSTPQNTGRPPIYSFEVDKLRVLDDYELLIES
jgi:hypothetical protein